jgi:uncharacterized protein
LILVDAGPLVAIVDSADQYHERCVGALQGIKEPLGTVWPALGEAFYLLSDTPNGHEVLWEMLAEEAYSLLPLDRADFPRIRELMKKYKDCPMELSDAALIRVAEREGIDTIFTLDRRDFSVYRLHGKVRPTLLP